jgi:hypothetical protein
MANFSIDVDIDDFDFHDILLHVEEVHRSGHHSKLIEQWAYSVFGLEEKPNLSVNDRLKMDFIEEHFDKLTLDKLQSLL